MFLTICAFINISEESCCRRFPLKIHLSTLLSECPDVDVAIDHPKRNELKTAELSLMTRKKSPTSNIFFF